jgi:hypothetical protein
MVALIRAAARFAGLVRRPSSAITALIVVLSMPHMISVPLALCNVKLPLQLDLRLTTRAVGVLCIPCQQPQPNAACPSGTAAL